MNLRSGNLLRTTARICPADHRQYLSRARQSQGTLPPGLWAPASGTGCRQWSSPVRQITGQYAAWVRHFGSTQPGIKDHTRKRRSSGQPEPGSGHRRADCHFSCGLLLRKPPADSGPGLSGRSPASMRVESGTSGQLHLVSWIRQEEKILRANGNRCLAKQGIFI